MSHGQLAAEGEQSHLEIGHAQEEGPLLVVVNGVKNLVDGSRDDTWVILDTALTRKGKSVLRVSCQANQMLGRATAPWCVSFPSQSLGITRA